MKNYTVSIKPNFDTVKQSSVYPVGSDFAANQNYANGLKLSPATKDNLGGVIVGNNLVVTEDGTLSAIGEGVAGVSSFNSRTQDVTLTSKDVVDALGFSPTPYKLIPATDKVLGGVKVGGNLEVTPDGTLSADIGVESFDGRKGAITLLDKDIEKAIGFVPEKIAPATALKLGGIKVGKNLTVEADGTLNAVGGSTAGVDSFNGRKGDVKLTEKDITDLVPKYDLPVSTDKILGGVIVGDNLTIDSKGRLSAKDVASGVETFNGRGGKVELTAKDVTDVVEIPKPYALPIASKTALGGFKVGKNLTISADGVLDAEGGGGVAGVTTFNGRKGDITLTSQDVEDVVEIASKSNLGVVKVGRNLTIDPDGSLNAEGGSTPYSLPIASAVALGGIKVGNNLSIDKDGKLSASGGGQAASHRFVFCESDPVDKPIDHFQAVDINGYVTYSSDGDGGTYVYLDEEFGDKTKGGDMVFITSAAYGAIFSTSLRHLIIPMGQNAKVTSFGLPLGGTCQLTNLGLFESTDYGDVTVWSLTGDMRDVGKEVEIATPELLTALAGDGSITATWKNHEVEVPVQYFEVYCHSNSGRSVYVNFDGKLSSGTITGLENYEPYQVYVTAYIGKDLCSDASNEIEVIPQPAPPKTFTLNNADGIYDGVKLVFTIPDEAQKAFKQFKCRIDTNEYDISDLTDEKGGFAHKGFVHNLASVVADVTVIGIDLNGIRVESNTIENVSIGAKSITPEMTMASGGGSTLSPTIYFSENANTDGVKSIKIFARNDDYPMETCVIKYEGSAYATFSRPLRPEQHYDMSFAFVFDLGESNESNALGVYTDSIDRSAPTKVKVSNGGEFNPPMYDSGSVLIQEPEFSVKRIGTVLMVNDVVVAASTDKGQLMIPSTSYFYGKPVQIKVAFNLIDGTASEFLDCGYHTIVSHKPEMPAGIYEGTTQVGVDKVTIKFRVPKGDYPLSDMKAQITDPNGKMTEYQIPLNYSGNNDIVVWDYQYAMDGKYNVTYKVGNFAGWSEWTKEQSIDLKKVPQPKPPKSIEVTKDPKSIDPWVRIMPSGEGTYGDKFRVVAKNVEDGRTVLDIEVDYTKIQNAFQVELKSWSVGQEYNFFCYQKDVYGQYSEPITTHYVA